MNGHQLTDLNIEKFIKIPPPYQLWRDVPLSARAEKTVLEGRAAIKKIMDYEDLRKLIVVGPCSIHDPRQGIELAEMFKELADEVRDQIFMVMRTYLEKPRTTDGWEGLIPEPHIDGIVRRAEGLLVARRFLVEVAELGVPTAMEFVNTRTPQHLDGLISYGCIGARYSESGNHRGLASGSSMPVGMKHGTSGDMRTGVDAVEVSQGPSMFSGGINELGEECDVPTKGNHYAHLILRGGNGQTNYDRDSIRKAQKLLTERGLKPWVMVDCSHGNSQKDYRRQAEVAQTVTRHIVEDGNQSVLGILIEANKHESAQNIPHKASDRSDVAKFNPRNLREGVSITDACMGWKETVEVIRELRTELHAYRHQAYARK